MGLLIARSVRRCLISGLVCLYIFVVAVHVSQAQPINALIVFGDSLSDSGNLYTYTGTAFPPSPPYDPGHFSNGRVWAEVLADALFLGGLTPSLLGGTNYSWGGAETGFGLSSQGTPNLGEQVKAYLIRSSPKIFMLWN